MSAAAAGQPALLQAVAALRLHLAGRLEKFKHPDAWHLADALPLVRFRAQAMQAAVPVGAGAMYAILGLDGDAVRAGCAQAAAETGEAIEAVGAPDATESFIGILSTAKFRDNDDGMKLGLCAGMAPFAGLMTPKFALITTGSDSPNAARLFIHYLLTEEGWAPQAIDGKMATNTTHAPAADEPSGVGGVIEQLWAYDTATSAQDWATRQDWQDIWSLARAGQ
mgnify:CR=1 FL=1